MKNKCHYRSLIATTPKVGKCLRIVTETRLLTESGLYDGIFHDMIALDDNAFF